MQTVFYFCLKGNFIPTRVLKLVSSKVQRSLWTLIAGRAEPAIEQICDSRRTTRATMAPIAKALLLLCLPLCILYAWILGSLTASTHRVFANWQKPRSVFSVFARRDRLSRLFAERIWAKIFWHCAPYYLFSAHKHMQHNFVFKKRGETCRLIFSPDSRRPKLQDAERFASIPISESAEVNFQKSVVLLIKKPALGHCYLDQGGEENANNNQKPRVHGNGCNKFQHRLCFYLRRASLICTAD